MKCCIVKDLLPGYIDGLTSEETNEEVKIHLENCSACNTIYRQMTEEIPVEIPPAEEEIDFLKVLKERMHRKYVIVALSTCAVLIGTTIFLKDYKIPVPYDSACMTVEVFEAAYVPNQYGLREWQYQDLTTGRKTDADRTASEPDSAEGEETGTHDSGAAALKPDTGKTEASGEYETRERLCFVLNLSKEQQRTLRINDFTSQGRTIQRNGKTVRVVYYCYTKTLWNSLLSDKNTFVNALISEGAVYEEHLFRNANTDDQPIQREIYYLPSVKGFDHLSDEEFDAQREGAELVWSGVI